MKTLVLSLFLASFALFSSKDNNTGTPAAPPKVIAKFDKISNGFVINERILKKTFANGGKIERFSIQKENDNFFLIRQGIDSEKRYRTEAFRLHPIEKEGLVLVLDVKVKWYTVCSNLNCWCLKVGNSCECAEGGTCFFGHTPVDDDIEVIVIG